MKKFFKSFSVAAVLFAAFASQSNALATFTFNHVTHEEAKAEDANLCFFAEKEILARGKFYLRWVQLHLQSK